MVNHRQLGVDLFNETWRLMKARDDDALIVDCAHASAYHWANAPECKPENRARSAWLISRVYTVVNRAEPAFFYATRCLELCEQHALVDWDLAYAYEALARASQLVGDRKAVARYVALARAVDIADSHDAEHLDEDLNALASAARR
jgi:hypothetical protein